MKTFRLAALVAIAVVLAAAPPTLAAGRSAPGGHPAGHVEAPRGFAGHPGLEGHRGFEGHRDFDRDHRPGGVIIGAPFYWGTPYYPDYAPAYVPPQPSYWYYCSSYGAYYPNVVSCPEAWIPVPAS